MARQNTGNRLREAHRIAGTGAPRLHEMRLEDLDEFLPAALEQCREQFGKDEALKSELTDFVFNNCEPFASVRRARDDEQKAEILEQNQTRTLAELLIEHWLSIGVLKEVEDEGAAQDPAYCFTEE